MISFFAIFPSGHVQQTSSSQTGSQVVGHTATDTVWPEDDPDMSRMVELQKQLKDLVGEYNELQRKAGSPKRYGFEHLP